MNAAKMEDSANEEAMSDLFLVSADTSLGNFPRVQLPFGCIPLGRGKLLNLGDAR